METTTDFQVHLNRHQRRWLAKRERQAMRGTEPLDAFKGHDLIEQAYEIACEKYGRSRLSGAHAEALLYLAGRLTGASRARAARAGHRLAGTVIQHPGAIIAKAAMPAPIGEDEGEDV